MTDNKSKWTNIIILWAAGLAITLLFTNDVGSGGLPPQLRVPFENLFWFLFFLPIVFLIIYEFQRE